MITRHELWMLLIAAGILAAAVAPVALAGEPQAGQWKSLFDGKKLDNWQVLDKFDFKHHGKVVAENGTMVLKEGRPATGVRWTGAFPRTNYEIALEARRVDGSDFFCGLTFPVDKGHLTLILGGWGGWVVGLSCIDGEYAVDNETCQASEFENGRWYPVRVRVTKNLVEVWLSNEQIIDLNTKDRKLTVSWEMEPCRPLGVATWYTTGELRNIRYRTLGEKKPAGDPKPAPDTGSQP